MQTYLLPTVSGFEDNLPAFGPDDKIPLAFNVSFVINARPLCLMEVATSAIAKSLITKDHNKTLARQWIFPNPDDLDHLPQSPVLNNGVIEESQWFDGGLNSEQRVRFRFVLIGPYVNDIIGFQMAVAAIALYQSPVPHLISGPPGTGKTRLPVYVHLSLTVPEVVITELSLKLYFRSFAPNQKPVSLFVHHPTPRRILLSCDLENISSNIICYVSTIRIERLPKFRIKLNRTVVCIFCAFYSKETVFSL